MEETMRSIRNHVRAELARKGFSLRKWSCEHGWTPGLVSGVYFRYLGKDVRPRGGKSTEVLEALEAATGICICGENVGKILTTRKSKKCA